MSNNAMEQAPEKSNFARKCNLLSRYLKQNGGFGGIDLGLTRKPDSDPGFAGKFDPNGQQRSKRKSETKTFDLTQKLCGGGHSTSSGGKASDADDFSEPEPGTSQMTIFFGGKVIVFNEFPEDKAKEIMEMAKLVNPETTSSSTAFGSESAAEENCENHIKDKDDENNKDNNGFNNYKSSVIICSSSSSKSSLVIPDLNAPTSSGDANNHQTRQQNQIVERIARRASLHRFFAKRKDRAVAARGPYQVNQNVDHPPKPEMASQSLERGQSSGQANHGVAATLLKPEGHGDKPLLDEIEEGQCLRDLELRL